MRSWVAPDRVRPAFRLNSLCFVPLAPSESMRFASRGARIRTLWAGFGGPLLSQEHAPHDCRGYPPGFEPGPARLTTSGGGPHHGHHHASSGRGGSRTLTPLRAHSLAARPGQPYPAPLHKARAREIPRRDGPPGTRTPISCLQGRCPPFGPAAREWSRPGRTRTCACLFVRQVPWPLGDGTVVKRIPGSGIDPDAPGL